MLNTKPGLYLAIGVMLLTAISASPQGWAARPFLGSEGVAVVRPPTEQLWLTVTDHDPRPRHGAEPGHLTDNPRLQAIFQRFRVERFEQVMPSGRTPALQLVYEVVCKCNALQLRDALEREASDLVDKISPQGSPIAPYDPTDHAWFLQADRTTPASTTSTLQALQGEWEGEGPAGKAAIRITGISLHFFARTDFWYETTFILPDGTNPQQLHATIKDSSPPTDDIGQVVFAIVKIEDEMLSLAVDDSSDAPPTSFADAMSRYDLKRTLPPPIGHVGLDGEDRLGLSVLEAGGVMLAPLLDLEAAEMVPAREEAAAGERVQGRGRARFLSSIGPAP